MSNIGYNPEHVETYLLFQSAFNNRESEEAKNAAVSKLKLAFKFISERERHWTMVIFREVGQPTEPLKLLAAELFGNLRPEQKENFYKPTFLYFPEEAPTEDV